MSRVYAQAVLYYESIKRELKIKPIYECRCVGRWKTTKKGTQVYYESRKRELKRRLINEGRCDERLKAKVEEST
jgi:hypothetical protein